MTEVIIILYNFQMITGMIENGQHQQKFQLQPGQLLCLYNPQLTQHQQLKMLIQLPYQHL